MKIFLSVSAWLDTPSVKARTLVATLPGEREVVRSYRGDYFLLEGEQQVGSVSIRKMPQGPKLSDQQNTWLDNVWLSPEYRGKSWMSKLIHIAARNADKKTILLDANKNHVGTYTKAGFRPMDKAEIDQYETAIHYHQRSNGYLGKRASFVPMILQKEPA